LSITTGRGAQSGGLLRLFPLKPRMAALGSPASPSGLRRRCAPGQRGKVQAFPRHRQVHRRIVAFL